MNTTSPLMQTDLEDNPQQVIYDRHEMKFVFQGRDVKLGRGCTKDLRDIRHLFGLTVEEIAEKWSHNFPIYNDCELLQFVRNARYLNQKILKHNERIQNSKFLRLVDKILAFLDKFFPLFLKPHYQLSLTCKTIDIPQLERLFVITWTGNSIQRSRYDALTQYFLDKGDEMTPRQAGLVSSLLGQSTLELYRLGGTLGEEGCLSYLKLVKLLLKNGFKFEKNFMVSESNPNYHFKQKGMRIEEVITFDRFENRRFIQGESGNLFPPICRASNYVDVRMELLSYLANNPTVAIEMAEFLPMLIEGVTSTPLDFFWVDEALRDRTREAYKELQPLLHKIFTALMNSNQEDILQGIFRDPNMFNFLVDYFVLSKEPGSRDILSIHTPNVENELTILPPVLGPIVSQYQSTPFVSYLVDASENHYAYSLERYDPGYAAARHWMICFLAQECGDNRSFDWSRLTTIKTYEWIIKEFVDCMPKRAQLIQENRLTVTPFLQKLMKRMGMFYTRLTDESKEQLCRLFVRYQVDFKTYIINPDMHAEVQTQINAVRPDDV